MSTERIPLPDLVAWTGGDRVVLAESTPLPGSDALGVRRGAAWAVAFARPTYTHGTNLMLHGDDGSGRLVPPAVVAALEDLVSSAPFAGWVADLRTKGVDSVSLPRTAAHVGGLLPQAHGLWEWMWTTRAPAAPAGDGTVELVEEDRADLQALLDAHNPGTDGQPFARPGQRWVGIRDGEGSLLAAGCCEPERSGTPVLSGITVAPTARGRGLGRVVTAELTRGAVDSHGWCTLGMYSVNDTARRLYHSLGYETGAVWSSGALG
ncbi:GNAT family N-acetyltransferase [Janibacter sp. DB-40]|uniref:GNAT family N-acetyltransferase n=1 Tax=Janibacter sp. DB-40 TaxID=3028808 RepID=UPI002404E565|nr:GNAT family N-acetyltransferase [Janibacter sp. DB-40]